jgi:hypothetical protein
MEEEAPPKYETIVAMNDAQDQVVRGWDDQIRNACRFCMILSMSTILVASPLVIVVFVVLLTFRANA